MSKIRTALLLGPINLLRVLFYRVGIKTGLNPVKRITAQIKPGIFFNSVLAPDNSGLVSNQAWKNEHQYFGWHRVKANAVPNWYLNPFNGVEVNNSDRPWWLISDFDSSLGDIKTVWEASRFDWALSFAQNTKLGDENSLNKLNNWITSWVQDNPPYLGPNWKCGQEASIRVMHLAMCALILKQIKAPEPPLIQLIKAHLQRIAPTIQYAIAQENNHGTSESVALYIGGSWLHSLGDQDGKRWYKLGLKWLENRSEKLIMPDGSFSQYSVNYHRVMLDTYCMAEVWRTNLGLPPFSNHLYKKLIAATNWLHHFVPGLGGDAPNIGANDGARLLPITDTAYRDFRPSVQLATALFKNELAFEDSEVTNQPLCWLGIKIPETSTTDLTSKNFPDGGFSVLRNDLAVVYFRYPKFEFRPSQADALHIDLWVNGENIFRDSGSYSYNAGEKFINYYGGTEGHNTVQFDDRDQMPRLSRFLFGNWLVSKNESFNVDDNSNLKAQAEYVDPLNCMHQRKIFLKTTSLTVVDTISGFKDKAILRWRLIPGDWKLENTKFTLGKYSLSIESDVEIESINLTKGTESREYLNETQLPVLEVVVTKPGCLITEFNF